MRMTKTFALNDLLLPAFLQRETTKQEAAGGSH